MRRINRSGFLVKNLPSPRRAGREKERQYSEDGQVPRTFNLLGTTVYSTGRKIRPNSTLLYKQCKFRAPREALSRRPARLFARSYFIYRPEPSFSRTRIPLYTHIHAIPIYFSRVRLFSTFYGHARGVCKFDCFRSTRKERES